MKHLGLTQTEATHLQTQFGKNTLSSEKKQTLLQRLFSQLNNFLTFLLIIAGALSFIIGEPLDGGLIIGIVLLNALFGLYQEGKAEKSLAALKQLTVVRVRVIRDGVEQELDASELVPGDVVIVEEGMKIPADAVIVESRNIELNESALTGESLPVPKQNKEEVFMGTIVSKGRGVLKITKTGMQTQFGAIAKKLTEIDDSATPLQKKLEKLSKIIGLLGLVSAGIVFGLSLVNGSTLFSSFLLAISLAVAVVPEGLPAVMTMTLAMGVREMAKKKSIVRKLSAIEALGSVTLIATDKTGTITMNKMYIRELYISGTLHTADKAHTIPEESLSHFMLNGVLNSTASLVRVHESERFDVLGDPTEGALLLFAQSQGVLAEQVRGEWDVIDELPFDSVTKQMTVAVTKKNLHMPIVLYTKGAPEVILKKSSLYVHEEGEKPLTQEVTLEFQNQVEEWGKKGLRVMAFGYKQIKEQTFKEKTLEKHAEKDFVFLGMVALHDAPRPEVIPAVVKAHEAGIRVVMITGDNEKTAEAIASHVGILNKGDEVVSGFQLDNYTDDELMAILPKTSVFARTTPFHKHRIVQLYQKLGEVVAVTGDGVNDAIALKQADVGVSMGLVGTDVARETSDMIITDDNFASIVNAVEEGRNIIKNLKNAIVTLLSCNLGEAISLMLGLLFGMPHLFVPLQLLYINLVTDGFPALAIPFSPRDTRLMVVKAERKISLLGRSELTYILTVGTLSSVLVFIGFFLFLPQSVATAKTAAFTVLTLLQSFVFINRWLSNRSIIHNWKQLLNPIAIGAFMLPFVTQYILVRTDFIAELFKVKSISIPSFLVLFALSSIILVLIELLRKLGFLKK